LEQKKREDESELQKEKLKLIENIKKLKKEDLVEIKKPKKLTIWQRIKKVLMG
jgi:hypothetical protein